MRIGLAVGEMAGRAVEPDEFVEQVRRVESEGFATAHFANVFGFDALTAAALAGRDTERIEIMTSVVPTFSRHPLYMAQQALSTNVACRGRFALGIGLSHPVVIETMLGLSFEKPYTHMREYVEVLEPLLRQEAVAWDGSEFRVHGQLAVAGATRPSLLLAALAPRMLRLCGTRTDGTITWMTGPRTLREFTVPRLRDAAAAAGRPSPRVVAGLPIAVCDDPEQGRARAQRSFSLYATMPSYRAMLDREGVDGPGDIVIVGDEDAVGEQLDRLAEAGVTDFLAAMFPVGEDGRASIARTREFLVRRLADVRSDVAGPGLPRTMRRRP